jgi:hypothetical protein
MRGAEDLKHSEPADDHRHEEHRPVEVSDTGELEHVIA